MIQPGRTILLLFPRPYAHIAMPTAKMDMPFVWLAYTDNEPVTRILAPFRSALDIVFNLGRYLDGL